MDVGGRRGRGAYGKTALFGIYERARAGLYRNVPDGSMPTLQGIMRGRVDPFSIINSDGWRGYNGLVDIGYGHYRVDHSRDEFVNGPIHIQRHRRLLGMCQSQAHQVQGHSQTHLSSTPEGNENGAIITGLKTSTKPCYDTSEKIQSNRHDP